MWKVCSGRNLFIRYGSLIQSIKVQFGRRHLHGKGLFIVVVDIYGTERNGTSSENCIREGRSESKTKTVLDSQPVSIPRSWGEYPVDFMVLPGLTQVSGWCLVSVSIQEG